MKALEIPVIECTEGEVLAADIHNCNGLTLVSKNTVMNQYIKNKLLNMGIDSLRVYSSTPGSQKTIDPDSRFIANYKETVLHFKQVINDITSGKKLDYDKVECISDLIYAEINRNVSMAKYLHEMRRTDDYTYTHCINTAFYSMLIGKWLELPEYRIKKAIQAGLLHDIGKAKVPIEILNKKGPLSPEDFDLIKKHPVFGYDLINEIKGVDKGIKQAVLFHHERIDRSGYPFQLEPSDIGLYSRIVAIADVYDAMTSDRVYKKRSTPFEAFKMFRKVGVHIFDTDILNIFLKNIATSYVGTRVVLNTGEKGQIVYVPPEDIVSPIVAVHSMYLHLTQSDGLTVDKIL